MAMEEHPNEPRARIISLLWQYSRPGGAIVFDCQLDRGAQGPLQFLGDFDSRKRTRLRSEVIITAIEAGLEPLSA
jgi:hypothetical protein